MNKTTDKHNDETEIQMLIEQAVQTGIKRDYTAACKILEGALLAKSEFLKEHTTYLYKIYLLLCRAYTALHKAAHAIFYGKQCTALPDADAQSYFFLGRAYHTGNDYNKAIEAFQKSLELQPNTLTTLAFLAQSYLKAKMAEEAVATFETALKLAPNNKRLNNAYLNSLFVLAVRNFKNGSYELARQMFTFIINNNVDGVAPRLYLAHTLKALHAYPEALTQYEAASVFAPDDPAFQWYKALTLLQMHEVEAAAEVLASVGLQIEGDSMTEQFLALGVVRQHIQKGDWAKAIIAGRLYMKSFGASVEMHLLLAEAQKNLKKINLSLNHYSRALELDAENPLIYYAIMELLTEHYRWDSMQKCILIAEKISGIDPDDLYYYKVITAAHIDNPPEEVLPHLQALVQSEKYAGNRFVYNALGICYVKLGLADIAVHWYEKSLAIDPQNEEAQIGLIACAEQLDNSAALAQNYASYFQSYPTNIPLRREYISFLNKSENWAELVQQLEILSKQTKEAHTNDLAFALRKNGEYRRAAILYRDMLKAAPHETMPLHNFVYCLDKLGQTTAALNLLQLARNTFGENQDTMIIEGILNLHCNRSEAAIRLFQYVAEKDPTNEVACRYLEQIKCKSGKF